MDGSCLPKALIRNLEKFPPHDKRDISKITTKIELIIEL